MVKGLQLLLFVCLWCVGAATIVTKTVTITRSPQSFTIPFDRVFEKVPTFAYYIQSGNILSSQFSVTHTASKTVADKTQIIIQFVTHKTLFMVVEYINVELLVTDENSLKLHFGTIPLNFTDLSLTFSGFSLGYTNSILEVYPTALPMNYTKVINSASNKLMLTFLSTPSSYFSAGLIYFSYIYITNAYAAVTPISLFQDVSQKNFGFVLSYANFAYLPSEEQTLMAIRSYTSSSVNFFPLITFKNFGGSGSAIDTFIIGYNGDLSLVGILYQADVLMFNSSFGGCPSSQFLYYVQYFSSLPFNCQPCSFQCETCLAPNLSLPTKTNSQSCQSCPYLRYLKTGNDIYGQCVCYAGLQQINGYCLPCESRCLTFEVVYIQATNQTSFMLYFSYPGITMQTALEQNLVMKVNNKKVEYISVQRSQALYIINTELKVFEECGDVACSVLFLFQDPSKILLADRSKSLSRNNQTVMIQNFVNYQTILPESVQTAFTVLSMIVSGSYGSGYTSLVKMLFELQQLIDAHKYLNLTLPVIFNQLIESLSSFRFMDLLNLFPADLVDEIRSFPPADLDQLGPAKLMFYESGVNFVKNIVTGIISCVVMLLFNYLIYLILKAIPLGLTRLLAKKIDKRKIITIHDTLEQLELPAFFFAISQFQYILLRPNLSWIYGAAGLVSTAALVAPFLVLLYIYFNRHNKQHTDVFEDLMQDNDMRRPVTYIYYVFNYYRKIFFALCLSNSLPGLVQVYLLITLNIVHLSFQMYLVVSRVYLSKSKVLIRLVNSVSIIMVQLLIVTYNLNNYSNQVNINIGMACFYLSITTAIVGIFDAFIKLLDTVFQEIRKKKVVPAVVEEFQKKPVLKEFRSEIRCKLGQDLNGKPKDLKEGKFVHDKELMEDTFHPKEESELGSDFDGRIEEADATKQVEEGMDLVFIDDDWVNVFPEHHPGSPTSANKINQPKIAPEKSAKIQLYQVPPELNQQALKISKSRRPRRQRSSKREVQKVYVQLSGVSTKREGRRRGDNILNIRPINQSFGEEEISEVQRVQ